MERGRADKEAQGHAGCDGNVRYHNCGDGFAGMHMRNFGMMSFDSFKYQIFYYLTNMEYFHFVCYVTSINFFFIQQIYKDMW